MEFPDFEDGSQDEKITMQDDLQQLNEAWSTEVHAPEILPYNKALVDVVKFMITRQEVSIKVILKPSNIFQQ